MTVGAARLDDLLAAALRREGLRRDRLDPLAAGTVDHIGDGAADLEIAQCQVAAMCRHLAHTVEGVLGKAGQSLFGPFIPRLAVAYPGCAVGARSVALDANCIDDFLAAAVLGAGIWRRHRRQ